MRIYCRSMQDSGHWSEPRTERHSRPTKIAFTRRLRHMTQLRPPSTHGPSPILGGAGFHPLRSSGATVNFRLSIAAIAVFTASTLSSGAEVPSRDYRLRLYHTHTRERLDIVYRRGAAYVPEAL